MLNLSRLTLIVLFFALTSGCGRKSETALCSELSESHEPTLSASRLENQSWQDALKREVNVSRDGGLAAQGSGQQSSRSFSEGAEPTAIQSSSVPYTSDLDVSYLPEWTLDRDNLLRALRETRDERTYIDDDQPHFKRRALWLYPYNACFVRAAHVAIGIEKMGLVRPGKVFAFGDLRLKTPYSKSGWVHWSYHVAPAYRIDGKAYVLDAGVEADKVISLEEWLSRIASDTSKVRISICDTFAYTPLNPCRGGVRRQERSTKNHAKSYLPDEWRRLVELNFPAEKLLGDEPPWLPPPAELPVEPPTEPPTSIVDETPDSEAEATEVPVRGELAPSTHAKCI